jgi:hypothetical protein
MNNKVQRANGTTAQRHSGRTAQQINDKEKFTNFDSINNHLFDFDLF